MNIVKKFFATLALILLTSSICAAQEQNFDMLATTYSENNGEALTIIKMKSDGTLFFAVTDMQTKTLAFVKFESQLYNFYLNKDEHGYPPLMFVMICPAENRGGADEKLGVWKDNVHLMPIYALFNVQDGQITFEAPNFYSGEGTLQPSHYHSNVTEPGHSRLIEIFIRHMPELHKQVQARGVVLP